MEGPPGGKKDRPITDPDERALFNVQIERQRIAEKIASGNRNPIYGKMIEILDKEIRLGEQIIREQDPDKKEELRDELDMFLVDPEVEAIMKQWAELEAAE